MIDINNNSQEENLLREEMADIDRVDAIVKSYDDASPAKVRIIVYAVVISDSDGGPASSETSLFLHHIDAAEYIRQQVEKNVCKPVSHTDLEKYRMYAVDGFVVHSEAYHTVYMIQRHVLDIAGAEEFFGTGAK